MLACLYRRVLRFAFRLLYNELAWSYDLVSRIVSLGNWQEWAFAGVPYLLGPRILELGHGPGHLQVSLAANGLSVTGIDISTAMGRLARRRLTRQALPVRLARARAESLPFRDDSFDSVLATFPTPYITSAATRAGIRRVLRSGGRLVIVPEAELTGESTLVRLLELAYTLTGQRHAGGADEQSRQDYWRQLLEPAGFEVEVMSVVAEAGRVTVVVAIKP